MSDGAGRLPIVHRRGPSRTPADDGASATSAPEETLPIAGEHRGGLAEAEADASYRWAAHAVGDRDVLVVGSRAGHGAALLSNAGARSVLGVDHDEHAVEAATRLYGERLRFLVAEPLALPLAPRSFDAVVCLTELEESAYPEELLSGLRRVLTEDGILLASLPVSASGDGDSRTAEDWRRTLAASFANVRLHRRGIRLAAVVGPLDEDGGPVAIDEVSWLAGHAGEDRSLLAVAGDGELPEMPSTASLTDFRDVRAYRETLAAWEQRARRAEADGSAKHWEMVAAREGQRRLRKQLHRLEHRPLRMLSRVVRGKPARIGPGPPIRASEREPQPWD